LTEGDIIPDDVLSETVSGVNLLPGPLRSQLAAEDTLLVFLRHFGCTFCRETVSELRACSEADPAYPQVLFFFMGTPREGRAFMRRYWPTVRAIADPDKRFYGAFGIERGGLLQMFGPAVWRAKRRAQEAGHENGERVGDIWMMPGVFLVRGERILWAHAARHAGDHPPFAQLRDVAAAAADPAGASV
jgi:hypothetical protein